jgi:hypothetical protein
MKTFDKDQYKAFEEYLKESNVKLNDEEKEKIEEWKNNDQVIATFDTESAATDYIKEYVINNNRLQYFNTNLLTDNVKQPFVDNLTYDSMYSIIRSIQVKDDVDTTKTLLHFIDVDDVIYNAARYDGIGYLINGYDGFHIEAESNTSEEWMIITVL